MGGQYVSNVYCINTVLLLDNKTVLVRTERRTGRIKMYDPGRMNHSPYTCEACIQFDKDLSTMAYANLNGISFDNEYAKLAKVWRSNCSNVPKSTHTGNGVHQGLFAGTLTMAPTDAYNEEDMVGAITKVFSQQTVPVKKWAWYREYTKNGTPHIHFVYETEGGGRIHKKIFQRYWKLWDEPRNQTGKGGFPGGYHSPAKSETAYLEYISKDSGRNKFKGFTLQNQILQTDK